MRDFRDAKTMAQTLRESLTAKSLTVSHSESLELVSKMLGAADWNTLSALIRSGPREAAPAEAARPEQPGRYPAIPLRDLVPFPTATYPIFVGRQKTMQALDLAFARQREVAIAVQKDAALDDPQTDDFHEIGVLGRLIQLVRIDDGTMKVLIEIYRRVTIRRFVGESDGYLADIADLREGPIPEAPELIRQALARFKDYAAARDLTLPHSWASLEQMSDPGRVADIICTHVAAPLPARQELLATLDPVARLEKVDAMIAASL
jgi:ATP-dependent Lon protease